MLSPFSFSPLSFCSDRISFVVVLVLYYGVIVVAAPADNIINLIREFLTV